MPIERVDFEPLIPHAGAMCLLDRVHAWDETTLHARTGTHRSPDNPLRRDGVLAGLHAIEYAAQAMAIHGGLRAAHRGETLPGGFLAAARGVTVAAGDLAAVPGDLDVRVEELFNQAGNLVYRFRVHAGEQPVADGELTVLAQPEGGAPSRTEK